MSKNEKTEEKQQIKALNPMLLLVCMILIIAVLSYIVPAGVYDRIMDEKLGKELVDPNSFHYVERNPVTNTWNSKCSLYNIILTYNRWNVCNIKCYGCNKHRNG